MVKVNDRFYIDADIHCYKVQEKVLVQDEGSKRFGQVVFKDLGYYTSIENCLNGILKILTREYISNEVEHSIKDLQNEIKKTREYLQSLNLDI